MAFFVINCWNVFGLHNVLDIGCYLINFFKQFISPKNEEISLNSKRDLLLLKFARTSKISE